MAGWMGGWVGMGGDWKYERRNWKAENSATSKMSFGRVLKRLSSLRPFNPTFYKGPTLFQIIVRGGAVYNGQDFFKIKVNCGAISNNCQRRRVYIIFDETFNVCRILSYIGEMRKAKIHEY